MSAPTKLALGAVLATTGALGMVLWLLLGWSAMPAPWEFLLAFLVGVVAGVGATFTVAGLIELRRGN